MATIRFLSGPARQRKEMYLSGPTSLSPKAKKEGESSSKSTPTSKFLSKDGMTSQAVSELEATLKKRMTEAKRSMLVSTVSSNFLKTASQSTTHSLPTLRVV